VHKKLYGVINKMNKKMMTIGIMALILIASVSAYVGQTMKPFSFLETNDLLVNEELVVSGNARVDGLTNLNGEVKLNNPCFNNWGNLMVDENGVLKVVCVDSK